MCQACGGEFLSALAHDCPMRSRCRHCHRMVTEDHVCPLYREECPECGLMVEGDVEDHVKFDCAVADTCPRCHLGVSEDHECEAFERCEHCHDLIVDAYDHVSECRAQARCRLCRIYIPLAEMDGHPEECPRQIQCDICDDHVSVVDLPTHQVGCRARSRRRGRRGPTPRRGGLGSIAEEEEE